MEAERWDQEREMVVVVGGNMDRWIKKKGRFLGGKSCGGTNRQILNTITKVDLALHVCRNHCMC